MKRKDTDSRREPPENKKIPDESSKECNGTDITYKNEDIYRKIFENSPLGFALITPDFRFFSVNPAWVSMTGYPEEELLKMSVKDITPLEHLAEDMKRAQELLAGNIPVYCTEKRYIRKDGSILWGLLRVTAIRDQSGFLNYFAAQIEDISDRKQEEAKLNEYCAYNRGLIEVSPDPLVTISHDGKIEDVNAATETATGFTRNELVGTDFSEYFTEPATAREGYSRVFTDGKIIDYPLEIRHRDGHTIPVLYNAIVYHDNNGNVRGVFAAARDITERNRVEDALRESEEKYRLLADTSPDMIYLIDTEGYVRYVNQTAARQFHAAAEDLIGRPLTAIFPPAVAREHLENIRAVSAGCRILQREITEEFPTGTVHIEVRLAPVIDSGGNVMGVLGFSRDITDRKKTEKVRERLISELAQKNTELDRFTYTVSHDLKSPLIAIRAFLSLLERDLKSGNAEQVQTDITRISESAEKLESLINTLLTLSRSGKSVDTPIRIPFTDLAHEATGLLEPSWRKRGITVVIPDGLPVLFGDRQRLLQVMTNLVDNAIRFMGDQKEPCINIGVRCDSGIPVFFVQDNGLGIKKENLEKIFGLFERFNPDIPGTGIGLATVKRIIEAHGGRVWAESEGPGKGTTVRFTLPLT